MILQNQPITPKRTSVFLYPKKELKAQRLHNTLEHIKDPQQWKDLLTFTSKLYKYKFNDAIQIYNQKPDATVCATYKQWNSIGGRIKRRAKGIPIINNGKVRYVFDIKDTNGVAMPPIPKLKPEHHRETYETVKSKLGININQNFNKKQFTKLIKELARDYTYRNISNERFTLNDGIVITASGSTAYVVASIYGLEKEDIKFEYFHDIARDQNLLNDIGDFVQRTSRNIIKIIEDRLRELEQGKPIELPEWVNNRRDIKPVVNLSEARECRKSGNS